MSHTTTRYFAFDFQSSLLHQEFTSKEAKCIVDFRLSHRVKEEAGHRIDKEFEDISKFLRGTSLRFEDLSYVLFLSYQCGQGPKVTHGYEHLNG